MIFILAQNLLQDITKRGSARVSSLSLVPRSENMAAAIRRVNPMQCNMMSTSRRRSVMANHRGGSGNFAEDRERASEAGKKGGQHSGGNFKNDPQRASEAGKKGGKSSHGKSDN